MKNQQVFYLSTCILFLGGCGSKKPMEYAQALREVPKSQIISSLDPIPSSVTSMKLDSLSKKYRVSVTPQDSFFQDTNQTKHTLKLIEFSSDLPKSITLDFFTQSSGYYKMGAMLPEFALYDSNRKLVPQCITMKHPPRLEPGFKAYIHRYELEVCQPPLQSEHANYFLLVLINNATQDKSSESSKVPNYSGYGQGITIGNLTNAVSPKWDVISIPFGEFNIKTK